MTTSSAAENLAGQKGKVEKRRALGRGLESLLPGPRPVVPGGGAPGQGAGAAGKQQVPPLRVAPGRNDNALSTSSASVTSTAPPSTVPPGDASVNSNASGQEQVRGEAVPGVIQAVAQDAVTDSAPALHAPVQYPPF